MAKPIEPTPVLTGKAAREFEERFLTNVQPDPEKAKRHKQDIQTHKGTRVVQ